MSAREVELAGGAPWGFRMHGGIDQNQPLRISRVNPGRKASLSGIREGDVISSINGNPTRGLTNSEAHAMLRAAGPTLKLGLNEDGAGSPRRRSFRTDLKRPSQLLAEITGPAVPQAPVYATIRPSPSPLHRPNSPSKRASINSLPNYPTTLPNEPIYHPTNPFYTTLPSNYSSPSKLPTPNGKNLDRRSTIDSTNNLNYTEHKRDFTRSESGPSSLPFNRLINGQSNNEYSSQTKNPFEANEDPFAKYLRKEKFGHERLQNSHSDSNFHSEEVTKRSSITEEKISEIQEIKTIKKVILNGSGDIIENGSPKGDFTSQSESPKRFFNSSNCETQRNGQKTEYYTSSDFAKEESKQYSSQHPLSNGERSVLYEHLLRSSNAERPNDVVTAKPPTPVTSPTAQAQVPPSPTKPIWRPGAPTPPPAPAQAPPGVAPPPPPPPPVWTPAASPTTPRKTFRPVHFEETPPSRRKFASGDQNGHASGSESESKLRTSQSAPSTGLNSLTSPAGRLPKVQNPTVTLLQKARDGQISRTTSSTSSFQQQQYTQQQQQQQQQHQQQQQQQQQQQHQQQQDIDRYRLPRDRPAPIYGDPGYARRREYLSDCELSDADRPRSKMSEHNSNTTLHKKIDGVGPTTKDGMPVTLRSEVKDQSKWYKKMYDTIHKNKYDDDYVTIRYKSRKGEQPLRISNKSQYAYFDPKSGYLSEPEGGSKLSYNTSWSDAYDSDVTTRTVPESPYMPSNKYSTLASARARHEVYRNQPGRIEDYVPGRSSVVDKETKQWWDEVMDIFDGNNMSSTTSLPQASPKEKKDLTSAILSKSNMARALKESGYESDSTVVFRRRQEAEAAPSPAERRAAYRDLQAGGEPPPRGFRAPAPPRTDDTEIEYIPISPTLTKIRIHKKTPQYQEVICFPVTSIETDLQRYKRAASHIDIPRIVEFPPAPPRRVSSKNSRTLKLVTSTRPSSTSPKRQKEPSQSNVDYLKNKISNKLIRQNTQILSKKELPKIANKLAKSRAMSSSAPPSIYRKNLTNSIRASQTKPHLTSSFSSPRRTLLPSEYNGFRSKYCDSQASSVIEGGAGRRTPISNILDKVTSLDKLWSAEKRNERIDLAKAKSKSLLNKALPSKTLKPSSSSVHKSRDMVRTAEKVQKQKIVSSLTKSNPCLNIKTEPKTVKLQSSTTMSKSSTNLTNGNRKQNHIKVASVTNLKKKKSSDNLNKTKIIPCHEVCSRKGKESRKNGKKSSKSKHSKSNSPNDSESGSQFGDASNFGSFENLKNKPFIDSKEISKTRDAVVTDSFFQHLFLGNTVCHPNIYYHTVTEPTTTVLQKAKMFQSYPQEYYSAKSLNSYLIHRKPVSLSRFKMWDRYSFPLRSQSPRSVSWPGRIYNGIRKFDSLLPTGDFGSNSSLATTRSRSEPPVNKIYFSQTSRPKSPTVIFHKKEKAIEPYKNKRNAISPSKLIFSQTTRPVSPHIVHKPRETILWPSRSQSVSPTRIVFTETVRPLSPVVVAKKPAIRKIESKSIRAKSPTTLFFSQTSRPVSPKEIKHHSDKSRSNSPAPIRSPSYRRINNVRSQSAKFGNISPKDIMRTRSAENSERKIQRENIQKSKSDIHLNDPEYDEYIRDMDNSNIRSERFRELNRYYAYLERVGELEKVTSTNDLRHRKKYEEIIDFDRWKKIRSIERAEEELQNLHSKLRQAQNEKDVLFYPRDVSDFRWHHDRDRGLRVKEKSVEDLKEHFQHPAYFDLDPDSLKSVDSYKPLWRGTSVSETAFNINRKNDQNKKDSRLIIKPVISLQPDNSFTELRKKIGIGNRLWSSLSMEQVSALKNQLNAIYSKEIEAKSNKENDKYVIDVSSNNDIDKSSLHVRCSSLVIPNDDKISKRELTKSESIAAISCPVTSVKELKNNVNKIQMSLSENEKKRISQSLSKEILDRINKLDCRAKSPIKLNMDNKSVEDSYAVPNKEKVSFPLPKPEKESFLEEPASHGPSPEKTDQRKSSASETDTVSSDISSKTVIFKGPKKEVQKKVEYFESVQKASDHEKIIYHARESSDEAQDQNTPLQLNETIAATPKNQIVQSQSCTNFKELFGESESNKFLSLPSRPEFSRSRSTSPRIDMQTSECQSVDTRPCSSEESVWRTRSPSPDADRCWRAYLKLARAGEVRRLARQFDSPSAARAILRRHTSDPEINYLTPTSWSSFQKFNRPGKPRSHPVSRIPLRPTNRYMPHIDVISKMATLRRRTAPRSKSAEDASECRIGEVERMRRRFETMSILGQIYTSAPDVSELRDMAPYLSRQWIAHKFPKRNDNNRSIEDPSSLVRGEKNPVLREVKRLIPKENLKLSSILKSDEEVPKFDPSQHRPVSRYEPPRAPPRPPPASWPQRLAPFVARHTVTFQESDLAPEPPRRALHAAHSDTESPRRYVEDEVNIHYKCPVRHDPRPVVPERELARQQAEHMKRLYRDQKRTKYLQENDVRQEDIDAFDSYVKELQDMQSRRHQDNFTPSQKAVVPLNRYDDAEKIVAKALYTFNGQTHRELSFRKGDIIRVKRQIDANWYEGEVHGRIGLFPYNYVELIKGDAIITAKKPSTPVTEGRARAKFDFTAQTNLELPLKKGEVVTLTRRVDHNWWEGRNASRTGIFPDSYVEVLQEPSQNRPEPSSVCKPAASPAAHGLVSAAGRVSAHSYTPQHNSPALSNAPQPTQPLQGYTVKGSQASLTPAERGYGPPAAPGVDLNNTEPLYVDTNAEAVPYRAMYKYRPQNPDELELNEGDTVYVLERCDDGWYVGSSQRSGRFGTFPGNYVERI